MQAAGPNMVHFVRRIKEIHPDLMVSQPTYGYPQVTGCEEKYLLGIEMKIFWVG